jgi:hypothetical protein
MSRLYDRIMANWDMIYRQVYDGDDDGKFTEWVTWKSLTVIVADNVCRYYEQIEAEMNHDELLGYYSTLPLSRPPLDLMFVEMIIADGNLPIGYLVRRLAESDGTYDTESPKFLVYVITEKMRNKDYRFNALYKIALNKMGKIVEVTEPDNILTVLINPFLLALSLMNCKNVELIDQLPPRGLSRKHERRTGEPLVKYKVIKVHPIAAVKHLTAPSAVEHKREEDNIDMPLSIWRGHFKDYRDGKGLFGNAGLKGVYWWDQHVRGSIEHGATIKDYEVLAPKDESQE